MLALLLIIALIGAWELYSSFSGIDQFILPAPTKVVSALGNDSSLLFSNLRVTAEEVILGILVAAVAGVIAAVAIHFWITVRRAVYPLLIASQTIPIVIIAPLLVVWFGYGIVPKLFIVALVTFFPITVTTLAGLNSVDVQLLKLTRTLDASRWQTLIYVEAPAALPSLLAGMKVAVAVAVIGAVFAEQAGSTAGLGHLLLQAIPQLETARAYAAVLLLALFALMLFGLIALIERRLVPWAQQNRDAQGW